MACFHPETFPPSTRRPAEAATRQPSLAHLAKRLSSILQIINHIVFNADSSLVKLDAVAGSFTQLIVKQLNRIRGVDDLAGCRRKLQKRHNNSRNPTLALPQLQRFSNRHQGQHRQYLALQSLLRLGPYRRTSPTHSTPPSHHPTHTDPVVYFLLVHRGALTYRQVPRLRPVIYRRHLLPQEMPACCVHRRTPRGLAVVHRGIKIQLRQTPGHARTTTDRHDRRLWRCPRSH
ncbi:hypothetical protein FRC0206_02022 [Corynebacterium diphtheriae]|nr:hypothetical protein FRC0205_01868 [Corynebacterium diphtheriae]CAB0814913.1 hypothetical protein FRC0206_02022 [Corynebacterium diphtheriae]